MPYHILHDLCHPNQFLWFNHRQVVSLEIGDKKRWCPGLVMKPTNHELDMKHKSIIMVKSFKDGKMYVFTGPYLQTALLVCQVV